MKIGIIGGGAVGLLFASYLSGFHEVVLYTRTKEQADLINEEGVTLLEGNERFLKKVRAMTSGNISRQEELLIIAVKQYHLEGLMEKIQKTPSPILFIQNGYSHVKMLKELPQDDIYLGVMEHGALKHNGNTVEHTGEGVTKIARYRGEIDHLQLLHKKIERFPITVVKDYRQMLQEKLVVNSVINPLTGILGIRNGELVENPYYYGLFRDYFNEISEILELEDAAAYEEHVKQVCQKTANNRSSLLKDLENGRKTEIDAISGYLISIAKEKNKSHLLTDAVYRMVKGKEYQGGDRM
ncbi:2-dehydropantoate 2-reductase [Bacillus sp. V59.32b]|uniref:2-dehydropantoate 2-reductase n=1 Tax=Bacillus sp. V59.32b TaxID=1758642 RepID=UPI0013575742|nr:2-dehydropantoate 2-reductase [Bacillus sp. V59.32b]